jgi:hypothetical protein
MKTTAHWFLPCLLLAAQAGDALELGARRELFVDRYLIDRLQGAELRLHAPQPANDILFLDRPWEGIVSGYVTVIREGPPITTCTTGAAPPARGPMAPRKRAR